MHCNDRVLANTLTPLLMLLPTYVHLILSLQDRSALAGKVVLITGCTAGLGEACVHELCALPQQEQPSKLVLVGRSADKMAVIEGYCREAGIVCSTYLAELTDMRALFGMIKVSRLAGERLGLY